MIEGSDQSDEVLGAVCGKGDIKNSSHAILPQLFQFWKRNIHARIPESYRIAEVTCLKRAYDRLPVARCRHDLE